jgi:uncharacterized protein YjdB
VAVQVGATITVVVDVTGDDEPLSTSITCTASNANIAVEPAAGSCRVTGVSEGAATLTVRVQRGSREGTAMGEVDVFVDSF